MMVIRADSQSQAEELIKADPFIKSHYYQKFVHEFIEAGEENNWLSSSSQTFNNIKK